MTVNDFLPMFTAGLILVLIEILRSYPAWMQVRRNGSADGISVLSTGVLAGTGPGWIALAVLSSSPAAAIATCVWMIFHILLCWEIAKARPDLVRRILFFTGISLLVLLVTAATGWSLNNLAESLGVFIAVSTAAFSLPALWAGMKSQSTAGLSILALTVNSVEALIYFIGGVGGGGIVPAGQVVYGYVFFGVIAVACNIPRLIRVIIRRTRKLDHVVKE